MTTDFETHPVGTARRLAELEGLAFARRRTECGCTTDEDAIAAYRAWLGIDLPDPRGIGEAEFVRWRRVVEAIRDRLSGREMVASPTYEEGYETGRRDEAQARAAVRDEQPIDPDDLRPGDVFEARDWARVDAEGDWVYGITTTYYLLDRPDPDAVLRAAIERALSGALGDNGETTCDWSAEAPAFVAALRSAGYVIEPAPKEVDHA